ncbi:hypothetical protein [Methanobacterium oryzae]|uniref:hypothetical protein n=1 Tax=Methanobacterium oryzae TaxID=69540 RepID=UPI003D1ABF7D
MKQFLITPAAGKRLIAKALVKHGTINKALESGTVVIIAGTTNGYIAEEILSKIDQIDDFSRKKFFRGIVLPPGGPVTSSGRISDESCFPGDVVIKDGVWQKGLTIFDVVNDLKEGDTILKGVNAINYSNGQAAIYIGDPLGGTIGASLQAVVGRRIRLILPVGLEKRVFADLNHLALKLNIPGVSGPRLLPVTGEIFTEIEAIKELTGSEAELVAGGGVSGAEGSIWLAVSGSEEQINSAEKLIKSISSEKPFEF